MLVTVYDEDIVSDDVVGSANIELKKYFENPIEHEGIEKSYSESIKICFEGKESGTLKLKIQYIPINQGQIYIPVPNQFGNSSWSQPNLNWQFPPQQLQAQNPNNNIGWDTMQQSINMNASIKNSLTGLFQPNNPPPNANSNNIWQNVFNAAVNQPYPCPANGNGWGSQPSNNNGSDPSANQNQSNNNGWGPTPNSNNNNGWGSSSSNRW